MKRKICSSTPHQAEFQCGVPCWYGVLECFSTSGLRNSAWSGKFVPILRIKRNFSAEFRVDTEYWNAFPHLVCRISHEAENLFQYSASSGISMRSSVLIRNSAFMLNVRKRFQIKFQITSKNGMRNSALCRFPQDFLVFCHSPSSKVEFFRP